MQKFTLFLLGFAFVACSTPAPVVTSTVSITPTVPVTPSPTVIVATVTATPSVNDVILTMPESMQEVLKELDQDKVDLCEGRICVDGVPRYEQVDAGTRDKNLWVEADIPSDAIESLLTGNAADWQKSIIFDPKTGLINWLKDPEGKWVELNGITRFELEDGSAIEFPVYTDIDPALEYILSDGQIIRNDLGVFRMDRYKQADKKLFPNLIGSLKRTLGRNPFEGLEIIEGTHLNLYSKENPKQITAQIGVGDWFIPTGNRVTRVEWRSSSDDLMHVVFVNGYWKDIVSRLTSGKPEDKYLFREWGN